MAINPAGSGSFQQQPRTPILPGLPVGAETPQQPGAVILPGAALSPELAQFYGIQTQPAVPQFAAFPQAPVNPADSPQFAAAPQTSANPTDAPQFAIDPAVFQLPGNLLASLAGRGERGGGVKGKGSGKAPSNQAFLDHLLAGDLAKVPAPAANGTVTLPLSDVQGHVEHHSVLMELGTIDEQNINALKQADPSLAKVKNLSGVLKNFVAEQKKMENLANQTVATAIKKAGGNAGAAKAGAAKPGALLIGGSATAADAILPGIDQTDPGLSGLNPNLDPDTLLDPATGAFGALTPDINQLDASGLDPSQADENALGNAGAAAENPVVTITNAGVKRLSGLDIKVIANPAITAEQKAVLNAWLNLTNKTGAPKANLNTIKSLQAQNDTLAKVLAASTKLPGVTGELATTANEFAPKDAALAKTLGIIAKNFKTFAGKDGTLSAADIMKALNNPATMKLLS